MLASLILQSSLNFCFHKGDVYSSSGLIYIKNYLSAITENRSLYICLSWVSYIHFSFVYVMKIQKYCYFVRLVFFFFFVRCKVCIAKNIVSIVHLCIMHQHFDHNLLARISGRYFHAVQFSFFFSCFQHVKKECYLFTVKWKSSRWFSHCDVDKFKQFIFFDLLK